MRKMKDSGIEWIGQIPSDWKCCKQKYLITLLNGRAYKDSEFEEDGKYKILRVGNLFTNPVWYSSSLELEPNKYCQDGDLLYSWSMSYAPVIWHGEKVIYHYHIWKTVLSEKIGKMFAYYYLISLTNALQAEIHETTMGFITMGVMNNAYIAFPPLAEQQKIADFLDEKCGEIDSIRSDIQKQIDILNDYKKSVITEAVTKGLNPKAKLKDSGIEWIGKIPEGWDSIKAKYLFKQRNSKGNTIDLQLLSPSQKFGVIPQSKLEELTTQKVVKLNEKVNLAELKTIQQGDFCISLRSFQGGFEYSEYEGVVSPAYQVFYSIVSCCNGYYRYLFKEKSFIEKMNSFTMSLRDGKNIAFEDFANSEMPVPPLPEQKAIADYLDEKCSEINATIADKQRQLETLDEYKKSLIFEYVTGKKEVLQ